MAKRTYTSTVRAAAARETRAAILKAAESLFMERGYVRATVADIADRAGVALNTVYSNVGGKAAIVEALALEGTNDEEIQTTLDAIRASNDINEILRLTAEGTGIITLRHEAILTVLFDHATADPAVSAVAQETITRYRESLNTIAAHLVDLGAVHIELLLAEQILWFYFGQGAWKTVREYGWTREQSAAWLANQAASALLPPPALAD